MSNPIYAILTISTQDKYVTFRTYDEDHGKSRSIYLNSIGLTNWLIDNEEESYSEFDLFSYIRMYRYHDNVSVELVSLHYDAGDLDGFVLRFNMNAADLLTMLSTEYTIHKRLIVIDEPVCHAKMMIPASTHKYIRDVICHDKKHRRAFVKAISRNFQYGKDTTVQLHPDYDGFFFRDDHGLCGGLIISSYTVVGTDGKKHEAVCYSVHT